MSEQLRIQFGPRTTHVIGSPDAIRRVLEMATAGARWRAQSYPNGDEAGENQRLNDLADFYLLAADGIEAAELAYIRDRGI